jgi:hypothetical protein
MATTKKMPITETEKVELIIRKKALAGISLTSDQMRALRRSVEVRR